MTEEYNIRGNIQSPKKRPDLLSIVCILTFIGSGLGAFSNLVITTSFEETMELLNSSDFDFPGMALFKTASYGFFLTGTILYSTSLFGAIRMWKLHKIGFHFYVISQTLLFILPMIYIKEYPFPYIDLLITAFFIILYARNLKFMS